MSHCVIIEERICRWSNVRKLAGLGDELEEDQDCHVGLFKYWAWIPVTWPCFASCLPHRRVLDRGYLDRPTTSGGSPYFWELPFPRSPVV